MVDAVFGVGLSRCVEGDFLWAVQEACNEFYEKDPFGRKKYKKHKKDTGDSVTLPFFLTDSLRAVLKLHGVYSRASTR